MLPKTVLNFISLFIFSITTVSLMSCSSPSDETDLLGAGLLPIPTISLNADFTPDDIVNAAADSATIKISGTVGGDAKVGDVVSITVNGVTTTGAILSDYSFIINVKGSDLVADGNQVVVASITTTDSDGNTGTASASISYSFNSDAGPVPTITIINNITAADILNAANVSGAIAITGTVGGDAKAGETVSIIINDGSPTIGTVKTDNTFSIDIPVLSSYIATGTVLVEATITSTDTDGNSGSATASISFTVVITPVAPTITLNSNITADDTIDAAEAAGQVVINGSVGGDAKVGDIVSIIVNGNSTNGNVQANMTFSIDVNGSDLAADSDKVVQASITTTDTNGNTGTASDTESYTVDTTLVPTITLATNITADDIIDATEAAALVAITGTVGGDAQVGDTVSIIVSGVSTNGNVQADMTFSINVKGSDLAADSDKVVQATITTTDTNGNSGTAIDTEGYTVDITLVPTITLATNITADDIIDATEAAGLVAITGTVGGDAQVGDTVSIIVNGVTTNGNVQAGKMFSIDVNGSDLAADSDKVVQASITTTDANEYTGMATDTEGYSVNTDLSPSIILAANITSDDIIDSAEATGLVAITGTVGGDAKVGDTVSIIVNGVTTNGNVQAGKMFSIDVNGSDLAADSDKVVLARITTETNGNTGTATDTEGYSVTKPVPTITLAANITADDEIDSTEASGQVAITGTVGGDAKTGDLVSITVNGVNNTGTVQAGDSFSINVNGSSLVADSDRTVEATIASTDANGNTGNAFDSETYTVNIGGSGGNTRTCPDPLKPCYDIVYVRYPHPGEGQFVSIPQGEHAYDLTSGADLMLLKQDGSEVVLVDCNECSVMDPSISHDGKTVFYSYNVLFSNPAPYGDKFESYIYKINLDDPSYTPIRLTYDDGFDSVQFKANRDSNGNVKVGHDQSDWRGIRDMAPVPLADGRLAFTSNRSALTTFHPFAEGVVNGSVQQLYVIDDHDGTAVTKELANMHRLETGNIHLIQHPVQLKDGRLLFSTWMDAGTKYDGSDFQYGSTSLFTLHPDGSNLKQFTEPHDHHKTVDHFVTQLSNEDVVWAYYYPAFDYGFGLIMRAPIASPGPDFLRGSVDQTFPYGYQYPISFREYDRKGMVSLTPHSESADIPANGLSGKYSMPSATLDGDLLVAYSTGSVNWFEQTCLPIGQCEALKSGIYLIPNATGNESSFIQDPYTQLIKIKDDPNYSEIWPRAVVSYADIHGVAKPALLNDLAKSSPDDSRLLAAEATGILGTSSIYNREPLNEGDPDPFQSPQGRPWNDGNWTIQGAEAGVFTNNDIYGVRIIATPPKPYTKPISNNYSGSGRWDSISRHLIDKRLNNVVARFGSDHGERWEILGEFPVKKQAQDGQGNPDTSWLAKIPADTPTFIQTIDDKGMTLVSEITWRALKPGEKRVDCGGCHAHSIDPLDIDTTEAGKGKPIVNIPGVDSTDARVKDGIWDLTLNSIPLLDNSGVMFKPGYSYGVEFNRDIVPILNNRCVSCHRGAGPTNNIVLDQDPWSYISESGSYNIPQISRYIRTPQARQSLLVWAAWGERLDGRTNSTRGDDIDYPNAHPSPVETGITDEEKRTIARWVDLGSPIDFPNTDGLGYTEDYQQPVINIYTPHLGDNTGAQLKVGFADAMSGIDWSTLSVKYYKIDANISSQFPDPSDTANIEAAIASFKQVIANAEQSVAVDVAQDVNTKNILTKNLPLGSGEYVITVSVSDVTGNTGVTSRRFKIN